jgi:hypothetical protein
MGKALRDRAAGGDTDSERAIRWRIALTVLSCDPLSIALTTATCAAVPAMACRCPDREG